MRTTISGNIRLTTPLHCAMPGEAVFTDEGFVKAGKTGGRPLTQTMRMPIVTSSGRVDIPYFPANDLRGRMRRKAAEIVMSAIKANGGVIDDTVYLGLTAGTSVAAGENAQFVEEILRARENVYMGIFGGGLRMLRSGYAVQDMVPTIKATADAGLVPSADIKGDGADWRVTTSVFDPESNKYKETDEVRLRDLTHVYQCLHVDDLMRVQRPADIDRLIDRKMVVDYQTAILAERIVSKEHKKAVKEKTAGAEAAPARSRIENMMAVQAICAGTPMWFRADVAAFASDAQIGLVILSLQALFRENALGGWVRAGLGRVDASGLSLAVRGGVAVPLFADASCTLTKGAEALAQAATKVVSAMTLADVEKFFTPAVELKASAADLKKAA